jgi:hypothetical protein
VRRLKGPQKLRGFSERRVQQARAVLAYSREERRSLTKGQRAMRLALL